MIEKYNLDNYPVEFSTECETTSEEMIHYFK